MASKIAFASGLLCQADALEVRNLNRVALFHKSFPDSNFQVFNL
jgi:hypothetical protein